MISLLAGEERVIVWVARCRCSTGISPRGAGQLARAGLIAHGDQIIDASWS